MSSFFKRLKKILLSMFTILSSLPKPVPTPNPEPTPDEPEPKPSLDELDPNLIEWDEPAGNVGAWPITVLLGECSISKRAVSIPHPELSWPEVKDTGWSKPARGNAWVIAKVDGSWRAATIEWLWNQQEVDCPKFDGNDDLHGPLANWRPAINEKLYVMISAFARSGAKTVKERSNIVGVIWTGK